MRILSEIDTIQKLIEGYSIARYGDGEIMICVGRNIGFQNYKEELSKLLKDLASLNTKHDKLLVALPPQIFDEYANYTDECRKYWKKFCATKNAKYFMNNIINSNTTYASSFITRPNELINEKEILQKFKEIWYGKKILYIVSDSNKKKWNHKLDIIFNNVYSIEYYYIPHTNAWEIKDKIINDVDTIYDKTHIVLCSCGPTATVLSCILTFKGYQCIDFGHFVELINEKLLL